MVRGTAIKPVRRVPVVSSATPVPASRRTAMRWGMAAPHLPLPAGPDPRLGVVGFSRFLVIVNAVAIVVLERAEGPLHVVIDGVGIRRVCRIDYRPGLILEPARDIHRDGDVGRARSDRDGGLKRRLDFSIGFRGEGKAMCLTLGVRENPCHLHTDPLPVWVSDQESAYSWLVLIRNDGVELRVQRRVAARRYGAIQNDLDRPVDREVQERRTALHLLTLPLLAPPPPT